MEISGVEPFLLDVPVTGNQIAQDGLETLEVLLKLYEQTESPPRQAAL